MAKNLCVEINVPIVIAFTVDEEIDINDKEAVLQAAKHAAQSAADDGVLEIQYDDDENGITLLSVTDNGDDD